MLENTHLKLTLMSNFLKNTHQFNVNKTSMKDNTHLMLPWMSKFQFIENNRHQLNMMNDASMNESIHLKMP
jgi:hypothetical protein